MELPRPIGVGGIRKGSGTKSGGTEQYQVDQASTKTRIGQRQAQDSSEKIEDQEGLNKSRRGLP